MQEIVKYLLKNRWFSVHEGYLNMTACQRVIATAIAVRLCRFWLTLVLSQKKGEELSGDRVYGRLLSVLIELKKEKRMRSANGLKICAVDIFSF